MNKQYKSMADYRQDEKILWQSKWLTNQVKAVNHRFEDRLLHAATVRDEVRRGVRMSDETIDVSMYRWIWRYLSVAQRYAYLEDVSIGAVNGRLIFDLLDVISEFEPLMTVSQFWEHYQSKHPSATHYTDWSYGGSNPDLLAILTKHGIKTATSSAYALYKSDAEPLPQVGDISIICYKNGNVCCATKTIGVDVVAFKDVDRYHAYCEGEGDRSLDFWRGVHHVFFKKSLAMQGLSFDESTEVVLETFEKVEDVMSIRGELL